MATTSKYTYKQFGLDIIALAKGELELTPEVSIRLMEKAQALVNAQESKAAYNAAHPKKSTAKGASAATMEKANAIKSVLTASPMTAAEINAALGTDYTALQVANAVKYRLSESMLTSTVMIVTAADTTCGKAWEIIWRRVSISLV